MESDRNHILSTQTLSAENTAFLTALIGQPLTQKTVWLEAITHGSTGDTPDYQRLEFLGDRVLGLVIAEWLHETLASDEGKLSQRLNALVARSMCAQIARSIGLGAHIRLGKQARDDGGMDSDNILGDVTEALIGASFITRGFAPTRDLVRQLWAGAMGGKVGHAKHPKSALQEWAAGNRRKTPAYRLVSREGPDHAARFTVAVSVVGVGEAQAVGHAKQSAETAAAAEFMRIFG